MRGRAVSELLSLPVRLHGIQLGKPVDALLDVHADRVLGFEVLCGDGARRFLPFSVARLQANEITLESALTLIDERNIDYYRRNSRRLADAGYHDPWIDELGGIHETLSAA
ncbi:MAG TPA: hypothetical protein VGO39_08270 [Gaiellaceae bacterium]|nr:hypothetical protein [Gaiellaceae bacterium]